MSLLITVMADWDARGHWYKVGKGNPDSYHRTWINNPRHGRKQRERATSPRYGNVSNKGYSTPSGHQAMHQAAGLRRPSKVPIAYWSTGLQCGVASNSIHGARVRDSVPDLPKMTLAFGPIATNRNRSHRWLSYSRCILQQPKWCATVTLIHCGEFR